MSPGYEAGREVRLNNAHLLVSEALVDGHLGSGSVVGQDVDGGVQVVSVTVRRWPLVPCDSSCPWAVDAP